MSGLNGIVRAVKQRRIIDAGGRVGLEVDRIPDRGGIEPTRVGQGRSHRDGMAMIAAAIARCPDGVQAQIGLLAQQQGGGRSVRHILHALAGKREQDSSQRLPSGRCVGIEVAVVVDHGGMIDRAGDRCVSRRLRAGGRYRLSEQAHLIRDGRGAAEYRNFQAAQQVAVLDVIAGVDQTGMRSPRTADTAKIKPSIERADFQIGEDRDSPAVSPSVDAGATRCRAAGREGQERIVVVLKCQSKLFEVVFALRSASGFATLVARRATTVRSRPQ